MDALAMGEYGAFVWSSYLLTLVVLVFSTIQGRRRHRHISDGIKQGLKAEESGE